MMDDELTLIRIKHIETDTGDLIKQEERINILCEVESVTRSEFYSADRQEVQPQIVFIVNRYDYGGQTEFEHDGQRYLFHRSYKPKSRNNPNILDIDRLEIVCKGVD